MTTLHPEYDKIKGKTASLLAQVHYHDHAKNTDAIKARKSVHLLFIENKVEYWDAYHIMRELIPNDLEFYPAMARIRETCLAVKLGQQTKALQMVEDYYRDTV